MSMKYSILFLLLFIFIPTALAQAQNYWHLNDIYNVELDGEGDAFVVETVTLESISPTTVNSFVLEIPYRNVQIVRAIQTPYYYDYYYPRGQLSFVNYTTEPLSTSTRVTFNLAQPLTANNRTTLLIIYTTPAIAKATFQGLEFRFETTKDPNAIIRSVYAKFYVPDDMELKGKPKFDIQYAPSFLGTYSARTAAEYAPYISYYYTPPADAHFSAKNLDPGESFTVSGLYGKNIFILYIWEILGAIVVVSIVSIAFKFLHVFSRIKEIFSQKPIAAREVRAKIPYEFSLTRPIVMGIVTGIAFIASYYFAVFLFSLITRMGYSIAIPLFILVALLGLVLILGSLFGPAVYVGRRFGIVEGILTFLIGVGVAVVILIALGFILGTTYPGILTPIY